MIAAIYARKSTEQRNADAEAKSVPLQIASAKAFAAENGWTVADAHVYSDDAVSGADTKRLRSRQRLLDITKSGHPPFDVLICRDQERFSREDTLDAVRHLKTVTAAGVAVHFYGDRSQFTYGRSMPDNVQTLLKAEFAAEFRRKGAKLTADAALARARRGHVASAKTFGYDNVRVDGHVERRINQAEAAVVLDIFQRALRGDGYRRIAKDLNDAQTLSPRGRRGRPDSWSPSVVATVLRNDTYHGMLVYNKRRNRDDSGALHQTKRPRSEWITVPAEHLRIIDEDVWRQVHSRIDTRRQACAFHAPKLIAGRGIRQQYLLTGFGRCVACGGSMMVIGRPTRSGTREYFYRCATSWDRGTSICSNTMKLDMESTDRDIADKLRDEVLKPSVITKALDYVLEMDAAARNGSGDEAGRVKKQIAAVEKAIRNLTAIMEKSGPVEHLIGQLTNRETERRDLQTRLKRLAAAPDVTVNASRLRQLAMKTVTEWQDSFTASGDVLEARQVLDVVLEDRIRFTPQPAKDRYLVDIPVNYGRLISAVLPMLSSLQDMSTSSTRCAHILQRDFRLILRTA